MALETKVTSFVMRFTQEQVTDHTTDAPRTDWRGFIKHVQTNNDLHFTDFAQAIDFIACYVELNENSRIDKPGEQATLD
jgi:hypothetical protein